MLRYQEDQERSDLIVREGSRQDGLEGLAGLGVGQFLICDELVDASRICSCTRAKKVPGGPTGVRSTASAMGFMMLRPSLPELLRPDIRLRTGGHTVVAPQWSAQDTIV